MGKAPVDVPNPKAATPSPPKQDPRQSYAILIGSAIVGFIIAYDAITYFSTNNTATANNSTTPKVEETKPAIQEPAEVVKNHLAAGEMVQDEYVLYSANKAYVLKVQDDGNLVVYQVNGEEETPIWSTNTNTAGANNTTLKMQEDGNLVLEHDAQPVWSSQTHPHFDAKYNEREYQPVKVVMKNDGSLVLVSQTGKEVWSSM